MTKLIASLFIMMFSFQAMADLVLYTDRPTTRMKAVADKFKTATGTNVQIVELPYKDLFAKLQSEGAKSPADVILVKDLVYLTELARLGYFSPMTSQAIQQQVLPAMRDPQNLWTAITIRARTLVYDASIDVSSINTYEDLAKPEWAQTLCIRSGNGISYNEALVASWILTEGYDKAQATMAGILANRVQPLINFTDDDQIPEAIGAGKCPMGIINSYYLGKVLSKPETANLPVKIKFLNQGKNGVHMNGMGAGLSKTTQQSALATKFIEFFLTDDIQFYLTGAQFDYPAKINLVPKTVVKDFGAFKADTTLWSDIGTQVEKAKKLLSDLK